MHVRACVHVRVEDNGHAIDDDGADFWIHPSDPYLQPLGPSDDVHSHKIRSHSALLLRG
jgi:hypothetical protein